MIKILLGSAAAIALLLVGMFVPRLPIVAPQQPASDLATVPPQLTAAPPTDAASPDPTVTATSTLAVYVCGAVKRAGVYSIGAGNRVVDAIAQAGGAAQNADLEQLNLAQPIADGMKIDVPVKGQVIAQDGTDTSGGALVSSAAGGYAPSRAGRHHSSRSGSHKLHEGQSLDVNTASESDLTQLPGVGPSLARRIVEYRQANGPFQTPDDLQNVSGIGPSKFAKMEPFIRV